MKSLKSVLMFWQEIVLVVPIGLLLIEVFKWVIRSQTLDGWSIFLIIWFSPLFICLIGQFYWKNEALAVTLSVLLGISSMIVIFLALLGLIYSPSYNTQHIPILILGLVSVIAVISRSLKTHY